MTNRTAHRGIVAALYAGLVLTLLTIVVPYVDRSSTHLMADHIKAGYPSYSPDEVDSAVTTYLVVASLVGVLGILAWLASLWAVMAAKRWARPVATTLFLLGTSIALTGLLTKDTSGDTGLPLALGAVGALPCLAGAVAVVLLWRRPRPA